MSRLIACLTSLACLACFACTPAEPPPVEVPAQPLVVGTSSAAPIATSPEKPAADQPVVPASPLAIPARDPRVGRASATRGRALIVTHLQQLETLFASMPSSDGSRPALVLRLADTYAELERTADGPVRTAAQKKALANYELFANDYPQDARVDEAYYYAGLEHELAGSLNKARSAYFSVISRAPSSKLVPLAYFAFAEMFFLDGANDPTKYIFAEQAFKKVLEFPPPQNTVHAEAQRRLSEIANLKRPGSP